MEGGFWWGRGDGGSERDYGSDYCLGHATTLNTPVKYSALRDLDRDGAVNHAHDRPRTNCLLVLGGIVALAGEGTELTESAGKAGVGVARARDQREERWCRRQIAVLDSIFRRCPAIS